MAVPNNGLRVMRSTPLYRPLTEARTAYFAIHLALRLPLERLPGFEQVLRSHSRYLGKEIKSTEDLGRDDWVILTERLSSILANEIPWPEDLPKYEGVIQARNARILDMVAKRFPQ